MNVNVKGSGREVADGEAERGVVEVACVLRDGVLLPVCLSNILS